LYTLPSNGQDFLRLCAEHGITTVIIAWREEWGPRPDTDIDYGRVQHCRLLAYSAGQILACDLDEVDRDELAARLRAEGLIVEQRCRNLS